jgi:hypothetical protein
MDHRNSKIKSTNYGLIFIIILITAAVSMGIYLFAQSRLGIRGYSWIFASLFWLVANFMISYFDAMHREQGSVAAIIKSLWECLMLLAISTVLMYFISFSMIPGVLLFAVYTFIKMTYAFNPHFHVLEKMVYADRAEIEALQRTGIWISDEILELENLDQLPKPAVKTIAARFKESPTPPPQPQKLQLKSLKLKEASQSASKGKSTDEKIEVEKAPPRELKPVMEEASALLVTKSSQKIPDKLEDILTMAKQQLLLSDGEFFIIPRHLSKKGADEIHGEAKPKEQHHMDDKERIEILFVSVLKDMADLFNMKLKKPIDTRITFPWELTSGRRMKLTERIKVGDNDIISVTGALSEDFTYALIAANLADIWFEENAKPRAGEYKSGFHFWLAYKLLKNRDFIESAIQASKQNPAQFVKISEIERNGGEYGVFQFLTADKYIEAAQNGKASISDTTTAAISLNQGKDAAASGDGSSTVKPYLKKEKGKKDQKIKVQEEKKEVTPEPSTPADKPEISAKAEAHVDDVTTKTIIPNLPKETIRKSEPVEIDREAAISSVSAIRSEVKTPQENGIKKAPAEIKRDDSFDGQPPKESKKILGVPVLIPTEVKKEIKEKPRMDPAAEASVIAESVEKSNTPVLSILHAREKEPVSKLELPAEKAKREDPAEKTKSGEPHAIEAIKPAKAILLNLPKKEEKEKHQERTTPLFRKAEVKLGKEESTKFIPLDLDMTRMLRPDRGDLPQMLKAGKVISLKTGEIEDIKNGNNNSDENDNKPK